jgi:AcrR family transcriptional regulator
MGESRTTDRIGRHDWIREALLMLPEEGISGVRVEPLASRLKVTKGSFYWHFRDRAELHDAMLAHWLSLATRDIVVRVEGKAGTAREKLRRLIAITTSGKTPGRLETAMRGWAQQDSKVSAALAAADSERVAYVSGLLRDLGLRASHAELRSRILYLTLIGSYFSMAGEAAGGRTLWQEVEALISGSAT